MFARFAVIGDSFAEGVGDVHPDGTVRGWPDLVAQGMAAASVTPVRYANLAVRGKLLTPILTQQLDAALALGPDLVSVSGGNNDIIRPHVSIAANVARVEEAMDRIVAAGAQVMFVTVADMTQHLPLGNLIRRRGDEYGRSILRWKERNDVLVVDNWFDTVLSKRTMWVDDRLHLNAQGHHYVANKVLAALRIPAPTWDGFDLEASSSSSLHHLRTYVAPWVARRVTGRSSGDGRQAKRPSLEIVGR